MELALDTEQEKQRQMQMRRYQATAGPLAMPQEGPGMAEQVKTNVMNKAMNKGMGMAEDYAMSKAQPLMEMGMNKGKDLLAQGITKIAPSVVGQGATNAALSSMPITAGMGGAEVALAGQSLAAPLAGGAGAGAMTALGTAMPYVGAAMLAGKALGFFNNGGMVGPLSEAMYKNRGGDIAEEVKMKFGPLGANLDMPSMKKNSQLTPQYKAGGGYSDEDIKKMDDYLPDSEWEKIKKSQGLDSSDNKYTYLSEYRGWDYGYD